MIILQLFSSPDIQPHSYDKSDGNMATQRWSNAGRAMVKVQNLFVSSQVCADFRAILQSLCCVYHDPFGFMDLL